MVGTGDKEDVAAADDGETVRHPPARLEQMWAKASGPAPEIVVAPPEVTKATAASWRRAVVSARGHMKQDRATVAAGAFAYRWLLSLFPAVIALLGLASLVAVPHSVTTNLVHGIDKALPPGASGVVTSALHAAESRTDGSLATVVVAVVVSLWSATSGMVMVEEGLDMAYEIPVDRSFVGKRLLAVPLLLGAVLLGGGASALVVFGAQIGGPIEGAVGFGATAFAVAWTAVRWLGALLLIHLLISFLYWLAPNARAHWRWASPGAFVATASWAVISLGFSFYTTSFSSYDRTYGAFAGVAILSFWLFLTGLVILFGAEINAAFEREEQESMDRSQAPSVAVATNRAGDAAGVTSG